MAAVVATLLFYHFLLVAVAEWRHASWLPGFVFADSVGLIPRWCFFAPNPAVTDTHLLYRVGMRDSLDSDPRWLHGFRMAVDEEMSPGSFEFVWSPWSRSRKGIIDFADELRGRDSTMMNASTPYLLLLNFVTTRALQACVDDSNTQPVVQFAVAQTAPLENGRVSIVFLSGVHNVLAT